MSLKLNKKGDIVMDAIMQLKQENQTLRGLVRELVEYAEYYEPMQGEGAKYKRCMTRARDLVK